MVAHLIDEEFGEEVLNSISGNTAGIFYQDYIFVPIDSLKIYWSTKGQRKTEKRNILSLYFGQWLLNVAWNPVFFFFHKVNLGLVVIVCLTILVAYFLFNFRKDLKGYSLLILPYFIWLCIATSLNTYIAFLN